MSVICYHCTKASGCPTFRTLYTMSKGIFVSTIVGILMMHQLINIEK